MILVLFPACFVFRVSWPYPEGPHATITSWPAPELWGALSLSLCLQVEHRAAARLVLGLLTHWELPLFSRKYFQCYKSSLLSDFY